MLLGWARWLQLPGAASVSCHTIRLGRLPILGVAAALHYGSGVSCNLRAATCQEAPELQGKSSRLTHKTRCRAAKREEMGGIEEMKWKQSLTLEKQRLGVGTDQTRDG